MNSKCRLLELPSELVSLIVSKLLKPSDLSRLLRTCKTLAQLARVFLYSSIVLRYDTRQRYYDHNLLSAVEQSTNAIHIAALRIKAVLPRSSLRSTAALERVWKPVARLLRIVQGHLGTLKSFTWDVNFCVPREVANRLQKNGLTSLLLKQSHGPICQCLTRLMHISGSLKQVLLSRVGERNMLADSCLERYLRSAGRIERLWIDADTKTSGYAEDGHSSVSNVLSQMKLLRDLSLSNLRCGADAKLHLQNLTSLTLRCVYPTRQFINILRAQTHRLTQFRLVLSYDHKRHQDQAWEDPLSLETEITDFLYSFSGLSAFYLLVTGSHEVFPAQSQGEQNLPVSGIITALHDNHAKTLCQLLISTGSQMTQLESTLIRDGFPLLEQVGFDGDTFRLFAELVPWTVKAVRRLQYVRRHDEELPDPNVTRDQVILGMDRDIWIDRSINEPVNTRGALRYKRWVKSKDEWQDIGDGFVEGKDIDIFGFWW